MKIRALLVQLADVGVLDLALLSREELRELSDALFAVLGDCESELEERVGPLRPREQFEVN